MQKLFLLLVSIAGWVAYFAFRSRNSDLRTRDVVLVSGASIALGLLSYYVGAVLLSFRYGA